METVWPRIAFALGAAYLIGGIPWALIVGKRFFGIDPRTQGSGNLGATNVFRVLGARAGAVTLLLDAAKGAAAVLLAQAIVPPSAGQSAYEWTRVGAMLAAVLGHSFSPYIGFKGGKGVATSAGALTVLTPLAALFEIVIFSVVVATSRMVSLGSIVIALAYPLLVQLLYPGEPPLTVMSLAGAALVIWLHRANIGRIVRGEERKVSWTRRKGSASRTEGDDAR